MATQVRDRAAAKHHCDICNVNLLSDTEYDIHKNGKKHRAKADGNARYLRTIHVTGFPAEISPALLKSHLTRHVGHIDHVSIITGYAFVTLPTVTARDSAVAMGEVSVPDITGAGQVVLSIKPATPAKDSHKQDQGMQSTSTHASLLQEYQGTTVRAAESIHDGDTPQQRLAAQVVPVKSAVAYSMRKEGSKHTCSLTQSHR
eukprot:m.668998 g.668998  ORF g.668998 m.668998 type:complete len:202 (-) comp22758_c0_seq24:269-874(-)